MTFPFGMATLWGMKKQDAAKLTKCNSSKQPRCRHQKIEIVVLFYLQSQLSIINKGSANGNVSRQLQTTNLVTHIILDRCRNKLTMLDLNHANRLPRLKKQVHLHALALALSLAPNSGG